MRQLCCFLPLYSPPLYSLWCFLPLYSPPLYSLWYLHLSTPLLYSLWCFSSSPPFHGNSAQLFCGDGEYNTISTVFLNTPETSIKNLFHDSSCE